MAYNPSQGYVAINKAGDTFTGPITTTGKKAAYRSVSANTSIAATDEHIEITGTSAVTVTLPDAAANNKAVFNIKNSSTATATIATTSSQIIDGATTFSLGIQYQAITVISNGSGWSIF
ncbi:MAG: hypothetical protein RMY28_009400 [Nostoc sp. ChiSLP01]|nr:hypothetical protein [Nostoc sp. CmiSLP01]MDZ8285230.1 hypothetical protein [Nostoc sp. ChiSLP01]